jgi:hypothetical protein
MSSILRGRTLPRREMLEDRTVPSSLFGSSVMLSPADPLGTGP